MNPTIEVRGPRMQTRNDMKTRNAKSAYLHAAAALLVAATGTPLAGADTQDADWVGEARNVANMVPPKLLEVLSTEIAKSGPAGAIDACRSWLVRPP